jgi:hypothetical protein
MGYLGLLLIAWACVFFAQRAGYRRRKRKGKRPLGFYPTGASVGNAFQALQALAEPRVQHVLEEKLDESEDEDDETGPKDPTAHLMRQARRIRNGKHVGRLTAYLPQRNTHADGAGLLD